MTNRILVKRSGNAAAIPDAGNLDFGELALNYTDGNLFFKTAANTVSLLASTQIANISGNATVGNLISAGSVTATGNVTAAYFIGDGSLLTGIAGGGGSFGVTALDFTGDGSTTTFAITEGYTANTVMVFENGVAQAPVTDYTVSGSTLTFVDAPGSGVAIQARLFSGDSGNAANVDLSAVAQSIVPAANITYDLGTANLRWRDLYLSGNTIDLGGAQISASGGNLILPATVQIGNAVLDGSSGNLTLPENISANTVTVTGNVTADWFLGNIEGATGDFTGNVTVDTLLGNIDGETGTFTGNVSGNYFLGNGSQLTGLPEGYGNANVIALGESGWGGNILPAANITYDLGTANLRWRDLYLAGNTIDLGGTQISASGGNLVLPSTVQIGNITLEESGGNLVLPANTDLGGSPATSLGKAIAMSIVFGG